MAANLRNHYNVAKAKVSVSFRSIAFGAGSPLDFGTCESQTDAERCD
jgi:hypothetical protein